MNGKWRLPASPEAQHRVFFALWPDAALARALADAAVASGNCTGRHLQQQSLHMTLAFIGNVGAAQLQALQGIAGQIRVPAFQVVLDRIVWRRRQHIVWTEATTVPEGLDVLPLDLAARLRSAGFSVEERPFMAHVTLLRDARCAGIPALPAPLLWPVTEFVLVESLLRPEGASYRPLGRYALQR